MQQPIIDSDRHVSEPISMWKDYLPQKMQKYALYWEEPKQNEVNLLDRLERFGPKGAVPLLPELRIDGMKIFNNWGEAVQIEVALQSEKNSHKI